MPLHHEWQFPKEKALKIPSEGESQEQDIILWKNGLGQTKTIVKVINSTSW